MAISGNNSSEYLKGTDGPDVILGNGGNDTLSGRDGVDFMDGGAGWDWVDYMYSTGGWEIDLVSNLALSLNGVASETILSIENVLGSQGNDQIYGDANENVLEGENGNDRIRGRGGNDLVEGENGNDQLFGDDGRDTLIGSVGADILDGGLGPDEFIFRNTPESSETSPDRIMGFSLDYDVIDISRIFANTTVFGNQAFDFEGELTDALGLARGPGTLWLRNGADDDTFVCGNTDNDDYIELVIRIADGARDAGAYTWLDFDL